MKLAAAVIIAGTLLSIGILYGNITENGDGKTAARN